jgi:hypothetical protein
VPGLPIDTGYPGRVPRDNSADLLVQMGVRLIIPLQVVQLRLIARFMD